jgi:hypothetical protein
MDPGQRRILGSTLIGLGIVTVLVAVIWVLEVANGPGTGPKTFAERRGYDRVKESVHETFPVAFTVGLGGLGLALLGGHLLRRGAADRRG